MDQNQRKYVATRVQPNNESKTAERQNGSNKTDADNVTNRATLNVKFEKF